MVGKKVSFFVLDGAWKKYCIANLENTIIWDGDNMDQYACGYVNPLSCVGLVSTAIQKNAKGIVNIAANSALGK